MRALFLFLSLVVFGCGCGSSGSDNGPDGSMTDGGSSNDVVNGSDQSSTGSEGGIDAGMAMPTALVTGLMGQTCCLATDATYLYYMMGGAVYAVPLAGGMPKMLAPGNYGVRGTIFPTKDYLYVLYVNDVLGKVAIPGGGLSVISLGLAPSQFGAVLSGTTMYWGGYYANVIEQIDIGGGMASNLFTNQKSPMGIAGDSTRLFWILEGTSGAIMTAALPNGMPQMVGMVQTGPVGVLGFDATNVYFIELGNGLAKMPRTGGTATTLLASGKGLPLAEGINWFSADGQSVWASSGVGIFKVDPSGTFAKVSGQPAGGIISDANAIYWIGGTSIYASPKP